MRVLINWLTYHHYGGKQVRLCDALNVRSAYISQYKSGKGTHGRMLLSELDKRHRELSNAILRAGLPAEIPDAAELPAEVPAAARTKVRAAGTSAPRTQLDGPRAAVLIVNLKEIEDAHEGGLMHVMNLGVAVADPRWQISRPGGGAPLHLRDGLRGQRAFAARQGSSMGGRRFEWWIELLDARHDHVHHGSPLWVARELTGTLTTLGHCIIGRWKNPATGRHGGPSSPALLASAVAQHCAAGVRINGLVFTGLLHPSIQELLDVAAEAAGLAQLEVPARPVPAFGARSGGLAGLKPGGSRLREVGDAAGVAFLQAMESISPDDPEGVFAQLMQKPSFRNRFLAPEWRDGLSKEAVQQKMLKTPFVSEFVKVPWARPPLPV
jgi:hypothetical protein